MLKSRRGFLATLLGALAALFVGLPRARAARSTPRRRPGNKTRWINHY